MCTYDYHVLPEDSKIGLFTKVSRVKNVIYMIKKVEVTILILLNKK
jgi:hypothetical protein